MGPGLGNRAVTRRTALQIPQGMPLPEWRDLGRHIFLIANSSAWWLGDWLIYGQAQYPNRYKHAIAETSLDYQTLRNYAWVARRFSPERRHEKLSFQHHAEVAGLPPEGQDMWLDRAEKFAWSKTELRRQIRKSRQPEPEVEDVVQFQVSLVADQKQRWEAAAESAEKNLAEWIISTLDKAATMTLVPGEREDEPKALPERGMTA
ncbi:LmbU family transcriptional regulator [Streptomyces sp. NPDC003077]|uniref:LmbU family transcriptional regulator n=1 Tax=Streptomyces sp. NPDC003077 TaxID=3154443 RepID=UPI0033B0EEE0